MADAQFPVLLASQALTWMPAPLLARGTALLMRRIGRSQPRLFANLTASPPCAIGIEPTDVPHRFVLRYGGAPPSLLLERGAPGPVDACVKGPLAALVAMLEGRLDGDALFFSRTIAITGDSNAVLTLRNLVDRDGIDVLAAATAVFGPFDRPARAALRVIERHLASARRRVAAVHAGLHAARSDERSAAAAERVQTELHKLEARLSRLEARGKRPELRTS